jgi:hypothetical protein
MHPFGVDEQGLTRKTILAARDLMAVAATEPQGPASDRPQPAPALRPHEVRDHQKAGPQCASANTLIATPLTGRADGDRHAAIRYPFDRKVLSFRGRVVPRGGAIPRRLLGGEGRPVFGHRRGKWPCLTS